MGRRRRAALALALFAPALALAQGWGHAEGWGTPDEWWEVHAPSAGPGLQRLPPQSQPLPLTPLDVRGAPVTVLPPPPVPGLETIPPRSGAGAPLAGWERLPPPVDLGAIDTLIAPPAESAPGLRWVERAEPAPPPASAPQPLPPADLRRAPPPAPSNPARTRPPQRSTAPGPGPAERLPLAARPVPAEILPRPVARMAVEPPGGEGLIGIGDRLTVTVIGHPELTVTTDVDPQGQVQLPLVGALALRDLSPGEAARRIARALAAGEFLVDPQVNVVITESRSRQISVLGEVRQPGRFPLQTRTTVLDALALAGGVTPEADAVAHVLRPEGGELVRHTVPLEAFAGRAGAEATTLLTLQPGDTVLVPRTEQFYVYGEVRQPNVYRLEPEMTVLQALSLAGGLTERGSDRRVEIRRRDAQGRLRSYAASLADPVAPGDVVVVRERFF